MKSLKKKQKEYDLKYKDTPRDQRGRLELLSERLTEKQMEEILLRRENMMNNIQFSDFYVVLYTFVDSKKRPRARFVGPKNFAKAAQSSGGMIQVYQPGAAEAHKYLKQLVNSELIQLEQFIQTPFICNINAYFPIPSGYSKSDAIMAEIGLDYHIKKPDKDNIEKMYLDMFNSTIWLDDNMCFGGGLNKFYSSLPRVEIHIRYMNCAMNKYQYNHIISRVDYKDDQMLYYLNKLGIPERGTING